MRNSIVERSKTEFPIQESSASYNQLRSSGGSGGLNVGIMPNLPK